MVRTALYSGSFDPLTFGHLDIITRVASMFDKVYIGIAINQSKKHLFTLEERKQMIEEETKNLQNVEVVTFEGLLANYVNENNFNAVIRGLRAITDFEYEIQMAQMNDRLFKDGIESVFLMTNPKYSFISSSMIKEVVSLGGNIEGLLPESIIKKLKEKLEA